MLHFSRITESLINYHSENTIYMIKTSESIIQMHVTLHIWVNCIFYFLEIYILIINFSKCYENPDSYLSIQISKVWLSSTIKCAIQKFTFPFKHYILKCRFYETNPNTFTIMKIMLFLLLFCPMKWTRSFYIEIMLFR